MTNFSENIKFLRKKMNLNQEHIAQMINVARNTYSHYESGRNEPTFDILVKLSKVFNCSVDYLLNNTERDDPDNISPVEPLIEYVKHLKDRKKICENNIIKINTEIKEIDTLIINLENCLVHILNRME